MSEYRTPLRNPLEKRYGWTRTRAGRWLDPLTGRSHTSVEAWQIVNERLDEKSREIIAAALEQG